MSNPDHLKQIKSVADAYAQIKNAEREKAVEQAQVEQPTEASQEQPLEEDADVSIGAVQKPKGANAFKRVTKGFPNRAIAGRALDKARKVEAKEEDEFEPHMMYDPKTGKGYKANTMADHLKYKDMGYTHEKPEVEEGKKKGAVTINPDLAEDGHTDVASAIRKCKTIMEDAQDIMTALQAVGPEDDLPTWWTNKMAVSANSLNSMRDYIKNPGASKE